MSEISAGYPTFVDGGYYPSALLREFDGGVSVQDAGSATAVSPAGGVFDPYTTALKVSAGTGMTVLVNAGSCSVPNHAGQGAYRFGLMAQATLTVAANSTGSTRLDYVLANVQDLLTTGSYAQIEYVTGTTSPPSVPNNSIILAEISVPNGASSIVSGDITDKRTFVVAPGGILPVASAGAAPVVAPSQLMYDIATGALLYSPYTVVSETLTGAGTWIAPAGVLGGTIQPQLTGADGGGASGVGGASPTGGWGGGGGEFAGSSAYAVTAGDSYSYSVGVGGNGGASDEGLDGEAGGNTTFGTLTAHGGSGGSGSGSADTTGSGGGTGSSAPIHYNGGNGGGYGTSSWPATGSYGGGSSASSAGPGTSATTSYLGAIAPAGGRNGGNGAPGPAGGPGQNGGGGGGGFADGNPSGSPAGGGQGGGGSLILNYVIAPGATPYPLAGSAASWYAYDSSTAAFASLSVVITADGVSDYRITVHAADTSTSGSGKGGGHSGQLQILCDGTQMDAINTLTANGSPFDYTNAGWTYYTSGAQGTTMSAGTHTIEFTSDFCELIGPAFIRVDQVVT